MFPEEIKSLKALAEGSASIIKQNSLARAISGGGGVGVQARQPAARLHTRSVPRPGVDVHVSRDGKGSRVERKGRS